MHTGDGGGRLIGTYGYHCGFENRTGEIGYVMRPGFRRKGYMKETLGTIIAFGFDALELERIVAYTSDQNLDSVALLERLDFTRTDTVDSGNRKFEKLRATDHRSSRR